MALLDIQVWSDIACPWCYVGKRRLEAALVDFAHAGQVAVAWRSFELDPGAPRVQPADRSYAERLARKYGTSVARAEEMIERMTATAAADGLDLRFDRIRPGNTFGAHRVLHMAAARGHGDAGKERLLRAYFGEGEAIGERDTLVRLAPDVGLESDEVRAMLATDGYARAVREDEAEARALGIHGVPFFVIGRYGVSGAQLPDVLRQVLERAWQDLPAALEPTGTDGPACGPDGC
jgi:predicted DsbA family dithiol-disulfide isomerase